MLSGPAAVTENIAVAPPARQIRSWAKDMKRPNRYADEYMRTSPWESAHQLLTGVIKASMVCVHYQQQDPEAAEDTEAELFICIFMSMNMINSLPACTAVCMDAKWRLNTSKVPMHALVSVSGRSFGKPHETAAGKPRPAAFEAGYCHHDAQELAFVISNRDNYWTHRVPFQALDRLLVCIDPDCAHDWRLVETQRGYYWERTCQQQRQRFRPVVMLDKVNICCPTYLSLSAPSLLRPSPLSLPLSTLSLPLPPSAAPLLSPVSLLLSSSPPLYTCSPCSASDKTRSD